MKSRDKGQRQGSAERTGPDNGRPAAGDDAQRSARRRTPLSRERIVATALALIEAEGLPALSLRRLGAALGCEAMSVYHYFPGKRHLLDALVAHVLGGVGEPPADQDAIGRLRYLGREYRSMAHRHPQFFHHAALHRLDTLAGVAFIERMLRHFRAALPDDRLAAQAFRIFRYYVVGAALDETAGHAAGETTFELGFEMLLKGIADLRSAMPAEVPRAGKPVVRPKP